MRATESLEKLRHDVISLAQVLGLVCHKGCCSFSMDPGDVFFHKKDSTFWSVANDQLMHVMESELAHMYTVLKKRRRAR